MTCECFSGVLDRSVTEEGYSGVLDQTLSGNATLVSWTKLWLEGATLVSWTKLWLERATLVFWTKLLLESATWVSWTKLVLERSTLVSWTKLWLEMLLWCLGPNYDWRCYFGVLDQTLTGDATLVSWTKLWLERATLVFWTLYRLAVIASQVIRRSSNKSCKCHHIFLINWASVIKLYHKQIMYDIQYTYVLKIKYEINLS